MNSHFNALEPRSRPKINLGLGHIAAARREARKTAVSVPPRPGVSHQIPARRSLPSSCPITLYWIVKHRLVARQTILGFEERTEDRRTLIRLEAVLVPVRVMPKRAHQGWRYLAGAEAPLDLAAEDDLSSLPAPVAAALAELALI